MSVPWLAFAESKFKIYFRICSLSTCKKEKKEHCFLFHTSPILSMLGWLWCFTMSLITWSLILSEIGSQITYSTILMLLTILEKKVFRICAVLISLSTIWSSSIKVGFSLDTILLDMNDLMISQGVLLSVTFFFFHQDNYNTTFLDFLIKHTE